MFFNFIDQNAGFCERWEIAAAGRSRNIGMDMKFLFLRVNSPKLTIRSL